MNINWTAILRIQTRGKRSPISKAKTNILQDKSECTKDVRIFNTKILPGGFGYNWYIIWEIVQWKSRRS